MVSSSVGAEDFSRFHPSEVGWLIAFINGDPTAVSPSRARMLRYPVKAKEDV
jgi:hypothetical protein